MFADDIQSVCYHFLYPKWHNSLNHNRFLLEIQLNLQNYLNNFAYICPSSEPRRPESFTPVTTHPQGHFIDNFCLFVIQLAGASAHQHSILF